ncbi:MAG TPA: carboxyltransferase domain-containing protein [Hyphomonas sp.]|nr:carboxyltransferase domain-containing protein [Hyphomonas sp.]
MTVPDIRMVGDDALSIEVDDPRHRNVLAEHLRHSGRWTDVVPGRRNLTVGFDPLAVSPAQAHAVLAGALEHAPPGTQSASEEIELALRVDPESGPDLARVADENGLSPEAFLRRVCASPLAVDMMGFMPGFAYLSGLDPVLRAERLALPRQRVAAGSVGALTGQLGLYALAGPGGWPIIGRIQEPLFDKVAASPFLLKAGMKVRLRVLGSSS